MHSMVEAPFAVAEAFMVAAATVADTGKKFDTATR
jgi:hypothetical protein